MHFFPQKKEDLSLFHSQQIFPCLLLSKPNCTTPQYPLTASLPLLVSVSVTSAHASWSKGHIKKRLTSDPYFMSHNVESSE